MSFFTQTSDAPYDSCYYELYYENGKKEIWEDYEELRDFWIQRYGEGMDRVEVISKRKPRPKSKGF